MADYPADERVDILLILGESRHNYRQAAIVYRNRYPDRRHPTHTVIRNIYLRARQGQLKRVRQHHTYDDNDVHVLVVLAIVHLDPHISTRQIERQYRIPRSTAWRILHSQRHHPYRIILTQDVTPIDMQVRLQFCQWAQQMIANDPLFFRFVMFSDEATFKNNGELNRHNCHYWSDVNPHWHRQIDNQNRWSINVWCGIVNGYLIGPYFFDGNVDGLNCLQLLRDHLPELLEEVDLNTRSRMWLQLDGAAPHYALIVRVFLNENYRNRWIGRTGRRDLGVRWPPRSPDLTSPDFYLWGYLKNVVFERPVIDRQDTMDRIRTACRSIPREVLLRTIGEFERRIQLCIQQNGGVFEHLR